MTDVKALEDRELDALVAWKVMGWTGVLKGEVEVGEWDEDAWVGEPYTGIDPEDGKRKEIPPYTSSPEASSRVRARAVSEGIPAYKYLNGPGLDERPRGEEAEVVNPSPREYAEAAVLAVGHG